MATPLGSTSAILGDPEKAWARKVLRSISMDNLDEEQRVAFDALKREGHTDEDALIKVATMRSFPVPGRRRMVGRVPVKSTHFSTLSAARAHLGC